MNQVAEFRAQLYTNRKNVTKLNVSGTVEEFRKLLSGDDEMQEAFDAAVTEGTKGAPKEKAKA